MADVGNANRPGGDSAALRRTSFKSHGTLKLTGGFGKMSAEDMEELINRILSEKGLIVSMLATNNLVDKFARHESSVAELRATMTTHEKGLMQLTNMLGSNKTVLKMDLDGLRTDLT